MDNLNLTGYMHESSITLTRRAARFDKQGKSLKAQEIYAEVR